MVDLVISRFNAMKVHSNLFIKWHRLVMVMRGERLGLILFVKVIIKLEHFHELGE